jgi:hypothetical protein
MLTTGGGGILEASFLRSIEMPRLDLRGVMKRAASNLDHFSFRNLQSTFMIASPV